MKTILIAFLMFGLAIQANAQNDAVKPEVKPTPKWTEADRQYLLDNLIRSKTELINETKALTTQQWNFKESPDRWSINQIVEHLALYELIFMHEIAVALQIGPIPNLPNSVPDSVFLDQDPQDLKKNKTTDYTKPFSITVPLGNNDGEDNLTWVTKMRSESIAFVEEETRNLRIHYINFGPNIHQKCMSIFAHSNRHLRQIKRLKSHSDFPDS